MQCNRGPATLFGLTRVFGALAISIAGAAAADAAFTLTWNVAYDQTNATTNQLRAVEVSEQAGNDSVYVGMIQTTGNGRRLFQFDTDAPHSQLSATPGRNDQPKAIATDDRGNVFVGDRISGGNSGQITTFTSSLGSPTSTSTNVPTKQFGGLATAHFGGHYYLYATREATTAVSGSAVGAEIRRYIVDNPNSPVLDTTFGTSGIFTIPGTTGSSGAKTLRGIDIAPDGTIFTANRDEGLVHRISSDLTSVITKNLTGAMDVSLFNGMAFVTSYNGASSLIRVYHMGNLAVDSDITISALGLNPYTRGGSEGWSGIDVDHKTGRIWLGDQSYQSSGTVKDRLLVSSALAQVPEPAAMLITSIVALMAPWTFRQMKNLAA
jgi:hypothetical protein